MESSSNNDLSLKRVTGNYKVQNLTPNKVRWANLFKKCDFAEPAQGGLVDLLTVWIMRFYIILVLMYEVRKKVHLLALGL